jgi:glycosyltransferase involved in cell wall biosynthesis
VGQGVGQVERVLIATDSYYPTVGGVAVFTKRLASELAASGVQTVVVCPQHPRLESRSNESRVVRIERIRSVTAPFPWARPVSPLSARRVQDVIRSFRPDVVHIQTPFMIGRAAMFECNYSGIPSVVTNHLVPGNFPGGRSHIRIVRSFVGASFWNLNVKHLAKANVVVVPSTVAAELVRQHAPTLRIEVVSSGVDLETFQPQSVGPRKGKRPVVLYVGRIARDKSLSLLLQAAKLLGATCPEIRLVGTGPFASSLGRAVRRNALAGTISLVGRVDEGQLLSEDRNADIFCMPSGVELQSIATLEAMAFGLPIVAANAMALPILVRHGWNGLLFRSGDSTDVARSLRLLIDNSALRRVFGENSWYAAQDHDLRLTASRYRRVYADAHQQP